MSITIWVGAQWKHIEVMLPNVKLHNIKTIKTYRVCWKCVKVIGELLFDKLCDARYIPNRVERKRYQFSTLFLDLPSENRNVSTWLRASVRLYLILTNMKMGYQMTHFRHVLLIQLKLHLDIE